MRLSRSAAPLAAALLLAACTPGEDAANNAVATAATDGARTASPDEARPQADIPAAPEGNDSSDGKAPAPGEAAAVIPARFHGEWNADPSACGRSTETRLRIDSGRLRFHESSGLAQKVEPAADGAIEVTAAYSGEGETWTNVRRLSLSGDTLTVTGDGASLARTRCP